MSFGSLCFLGLFSEKIVLEQVAQPGTARPGGEASTKRKEERCQSAVTPDYAGELLIGRELCKLSPEL